MAAMTSFHAEKMLLSVRGTALCGHQLILNEFIDGYLRHFFAETRRIVTSLF